jgi:hypothetical protein
LVVDDFGPCCAKLTQHSRLRRGGGGGPKEK